MSALTSGCHPRISDCFLRKHLGRLWLFRNVTERIQAEHKSQAAYEEVERLAIVDPLTGIANRRRFEECLDGEWRRAIREQHRFRWCSLK
jgi:PleD family two-component response regulator